MWGCQEHAEYIAKNFDHLEKGQKPLNIQDPALAGATPQGSEVAKSSQVGTGQPTPESTIPTRPEASPISGTSYHGVISARSCSNHD